MNFLSHETNRKLTKVLQQASDAPVRSAVLVGLVAPASLYGAYEAYADVASILGLTGPLYYAGVTLIIMALMIILGVMRKRLDVFAKYNMEDRGKSIATRLEQDWHINSDGSRRVEITMEKVFHRSPDPEDFKDCIFSSRQLGFPGSEYQSPDSEIVSVDNSPNDHFAVYYEPKDRVVVGVPSNHEYSYQMPSMGSITEKKFTFSSTVPIGHLKAKITADREIVKYQVIEGDGTVHFDNEDGIERFSDFDIVRVVTSANKHSLALDFGNISGGDQFFVIVKLSCEDSPDMAH